MNLGQSFVISLPCLTAEATIIFTSLTMRNNCFNHIPCFIYPCFPSLFCGKVAPISQCPSYCLPISHQSLPWITHRKAQCLWQLEPFPPRWTGNWLSQQNTLSFPPAAPFLTLMKTAQIGCRKGFESRNKYSALLCKCIWNCGELHFIILQLYFSILHSKQEKFSSSLL